MSIFSDSPAGAWYEEPRTLECPTCGAASARSNILRHIENTLYDCGVSGKHMKDTLSSEELLSVLEFCEEDVSLALERDGGVRCRNHRITT